MDTNTILVTTHRYAYADNFQKVNEGLADVSLENCGLNRVFCFVALGLLAELLACLRVCSLLLSL